MKTGPRYVKGGIKAQQKRGAFVKSWWGKQWLSALDHFDAASKLTRGRDYARKGQVTCLDIEAGSVTAEVQGSQTEAYDVILQFPQIDSENWSKIVELLLEQPIYLTQMLAGQMPVEIVAIFDEFSLSLFPQVISDIKIECSCPDSHALCKHSAAVFYLMAEAFDNDPFLLFKLRGMDRETLLNSIKSESKITKNKAEEFALAPEPLELEDFWNSPEQFKRINIQNSKVQVNAAIPKRLGKIPFWRSKTNFLKEMTKHYQVASDDAIMKLED